MARPLKKARSKENELPSVHPGMLQRRPIRPAMEQVMLEVGR